MNRVDALRKVDSFVVSYALEKKPKSKKTYLEETEDPMTYFIDDWTNGEEDLVKKITDSDLLDSNDKKEGIQFAKQKFNILCQRAYAGAALLTEEEMEKAEPGYKPFVLWGSMKK